MALSTNLSATTREIWDRTAYTQAWMRMILFALIMERNQVMKCGTAIKHTIDYEEMDDLFQEYASGEPLTGGTTPMATTAMWYRKRAQLPVEIDGDDWIAAGGAGGGDSGRVIPFKQWLVAKAHRAMRLAMNKAVYRVGSATRDAQGVKGIQGIPDALTHDLQYGGLTRATTVTNKLWQGASLAQTWADQGTAMSPSVENFRACLDSISEHFEGGYENCVAITSTTNFRYLQNQLDGTASYTPRGKHAKFGFTSFEIDGVEVFAEPWFTNIRNAARTDMAKYMYFLNLSTWTLHLDPERKLGKLGPFIDQSEQQNGLDQYLARIKFAGNLTCHQPNANLFKTNVAFG